PLPMPRPLVAMPAPRPPHPPSAESMADLCAGAMRGDRPAFEKLHRRLNPGLQRMLQGRTSGRADLAEELAQRTWVGVWEALIAGKYDPAKSAITTFVYAVSHKVWLQHLRTASRQAAPTEATAEITAGRGGGDVPSDAAGLSELLSAVRECMDGAERGIVG